MAYDGVAKVQHYVPKFLLRNFGVGKKDRLNVFDKQKNTTFPTNCKNIASESRFYDFEVGGRFYSVEPSLQKIEDMAKPILKSILDADSLSQLSAEDRGKFSIFLAVQLARTKWFREQFRLLPDLLGKQLRQREEGEGTLSLIKELTREPEDNDLAVQAIHAMAKAPQNFAIHFANKLWVLLATDSKHPFWIGDNPIGLQNMVDLEPYGNLGIASRGIEIYFPLSPGRALAMFCQTYESAFLKAARSQGSGGLASRIVRALDSEALLEYPPECVLNFNSLQVKHAERFVFSNVDDFSLARQMIDTDDRFRTGPRVALN